MRARVIATVLIALTGSFVAHADTVATTSAPQAHFLFVGSYHMANPGRDVHNTKADDVLSARRQREIAKVSRLIERYRPTKVMVEADTSGQDALDARFAESCHGDRPLERNEIEQLGFRIACSQKLGTVHAVDWNELGPIKSEDSIDYRAAVERHQQQAKYQAHLALGQAEAEKGQRLLDQGSVGDMLRHLNSDAYLKQNGRAYFRIGLLGTADDPIGANWVQLWFGRNLAIFNNIVRRTDAGDRVLVIYGAGHGNHLLQLARESGLYHVQSTAAWLSPP